MVSGYVISLLYSTVLVILTVTTHVNTQESQYCEKGDEYSSEDTTCTTHKEFSNKRFILYDVNPPEGFNLRRDVYVRTAIFVKHLLEKHKRYEWRLVLPPWGNLYHWKSTDIGPQRQIPWSTFFDIDSMKKYVPVMEMQDFFEEYSPKSKICTIDRVYVLKNDDEMFKTGDFVDKNEPVDCNPGYKQRFWGYSNITGKEIKCLIFHGTMLGLRKNLHPEIHSSVMFDHMEIPLHDSYGGGEYWRARRSMRYNPALYKIANDYREKYLNSNDADDKTVQPLDWTVEKERRTALGGPYLCVHLRRRDFLTGRANSVPSIKSAADQLIKKLKELHLRTLFVATDAEDHEYEELKSFLENEYAVHKYSPTAGDRKLYKDGGVAIVDQIICSRAKYFVGTHESTFTFRIQEEREILGFESRTTFNRLCGKEKKCKSGSTWKIVWK